MASQKITVSTIVHKPLKDTWDLYNEPAHITKWNQASEDWHCPSASNDLIAGGKYMSRMESKDGTMGFDFEAVYDIVDAPHRFAYTMSDQRSVQATFDEVDGNTKVSVTFDAEQENPVEIQKQGWQAIMDNFKRYAESV